MKSRINIDKEYLITYKKWLIHKKCVFRSIDSEYIEYKEGDIFNCLDQYCLELGSPQGSQNWSLRSGESYMNLISYFCSNQDEEQHVCVLADIHIDPYVRRKGVGTHLMQIFYGICRKNNVDVIVGDMESRDDVEGRKRFFKKNGFQIYQSEKAKFGWIIIKHLTEKLV